jgi:hypothetical protein
VIYVYNKHVNDTEKRIEKNENRINKIENNYLTRFDNVVATIHAIKEEIITEIAKTRHDSREQNQKLQFNTELYYQRKENCLIHGAEIKDLKKELEFIKQKLMEK